MRLRLPPGHFLVNNHVVITALAHTHAAEQPRPLPVIPVGQRYFITSISLYKKERDFLMMEHVSRLRSGWSGLSSISCIVRCAIRALADQPPAERFRELSFDR